MTKKLFDATVAVIAGIALLPVMVATGLYIWATLGRPIFFRQKRAGVNGEPFRLLKFRTMLPERASDGHLRQEAERIPAGGRFLRSSSIDELPTIFNVIAGDMSLVGPRPLLLDYTPLYNATQFRRLSVKPGITGWAQIHGRNAIDWDRKFELDVWYVDHRSFWLDLKIIAMTVQKVLRRDGVNADETQAMPRFEGSQQ